VQLTLSTKEQELLAAAARALLSPFDLPDLDRWRAEVLARLAELVEADYGGFILPRPGAAPFTLHNLPESFGREYFEANDGLDEESMRAIRRMGGGVWNTRTLGEAQGMVMPDDWLASPSYRSFYSRYRIQDGLGFTAFSVHPAGDLLRPGPDGGPTAAVLTCFREDYGSEAFGERGLAILRLLLPALEAGVATRVRLAGRERALEQVFAASRDGIAVHTLDGRLLYANGAFSQILRDDPAHARLDAALAAGVRALSALARSGGAAEPRRFAGANRELLTPTARYRIRLSLIGEGLFTDRPTVLAALERLNPEPPSPRVLRERWGLTPQEARVALLLASGRSNREIAAAMELSPATVRHYTEAVFFKLGTHARAEVAARVLTS
jgi:DNA-binding CsgD family transcriptional regulator/PAS domain-containing protein